RRSAVCCDHHDHPAIRRLPDGPANSARLDASHVGHVHSSAGCAHPTARSLKEYCVGTRTTGPQKSRTTTNGRIKAAEAPKGSANGARADKWRFRIAAFAIIEREGLVMLARRRDIGWWNLPGGGLESGETVDEGLLREVREEVCVAVRVVRMV